MKNKMLVLTLAVLGLAACGGNKPAADAASAAPAASDVVAASVPAAAENASAAVPDMHNAQNALDWPGSYKGTLPCASCEGIDTELVLKDDGSYQLTEDYKGGKEALKETVSGKFTWLPGGSVVQLDAAADQRQYFVAEGEIRHLDADGKEVTGELAEHYVLKKVQ